MDEFMHENTHEIVCPYCGYEFEDSWEVCMDTDGQLDNQECPECCKEFEAERILSVDYCTRKLLED